MKKNITACIRRTVFFSILLFAVFMCTGMQFSYSVTWSITVSVFAFMLYSRYLWVYNPLLQMPRIYGKYKGEIHYKFNGGSIKETNVEISQTLFHSNIKLITDEVISYSKTSEIIMEDNSYILYYSYIKKPKSAIEKQNPIQYGTCRIVLADERNLVFSNHKNTELSFKNLLQKLKSALFTRIFPSDKKLHGTYWTSFETTGDIYLKRISD